MSSQTGPWVQYNKLLNFFQSRSGRTVTMQQIINATGIPRGSIPGISKRIEQDFPGCLSKPGRGRYHWENEPIKADKPVDLLTPEPHTESPKIAPGDLIEVVRLTKNGSWIVETSSGTVFLCSSPMPIDDL